MARSPAKWIWSSLACVALSLDAWAVQAQDLPTPIDSEPTLSELLGDTAMEDSEEPEHFHSYSGSDTDTDSESMVDSETATNEDETETGANDEAETGETELIQERYPNRAIKIEREVTQDAQGNYINHGFWRMYDQRGNLVAEGQYRMGDREGTWNRWFRNGEADLFSKPPYNQFTGPFISQATFHGGNLEGKWTIYDSKQRKISEWEFVAGQRHGKSVWWYANGRKMREIDYRDGAVDGQLMEWSVDAKLTLNDTYQLGRKLAPKSELHKSNQKKSEGMYLFAKDVVETPDDWWNAKIATYTKQGRDEKHGKWTSWYATGQKQLEGEYKNDVQVGTFTWWHSNGQKSLEGLYEEGKQQGRWVWWHQNGQKSIQGEFVNGNPTGRWTWWNADGKVAQAADLSHSEGEIVEMPKDELDAVGPQATPQPLNRPSFKR